MALCIFLFCTLQTVLAQINGLLEGTSAKRLVTRHAVSIVFNLPLSYDTRIAGVAGRASASPTVAWFGGSLPAKKEEAKTEESTTTDFSNFFPNLAVEPEPYFAMYPEYQLPPDQYQAFLQDLRGCVIGRKLADKFGWKIGDTSTWRASSRPTASATGRSSSWCRGIFDTDLAKYPGTDTNLMLFHFKYLYEATGRRLGAGHVLRARSTIRTRPAAVSKAIDALFENSDAQTRTETEKAFAASFMAMAGNLALLLNGIGLAVTFTILLVIANTMSIAVRERRKEIAVLKTLGFTSGQVMGLIVAESLLIGVLGGALGIAAQPGADVAAHPRAGDQGRARRPRPERARPAAAGGGARLRASPSSWASPPASCPRSTPTGRGSPTC